MSTRQSIALALGLILASPSVSTSPARADECKQMSESKWFKKRRGCKKGCVGEITALTKKSVFFRKGNSIGEATIAKHAGGYYLGLRTQIDNMTKEYDVRAKKDALVLVLDNGKQMRLRAACSKPSVQKMLAMCFCGFYEITKQQLQTLTKRKVVEVRQYVVAPKNLDRMRLKRTKDGRSYFYWDLSKNRGELTDHAECALAF